MSLAILALIGNLIQDRLDQVCLRYMNVTYSDLYHSYFLSSYLNIKFRAKDERMNEILRLETVQMEFKGWRTYLKYYFASGIPGLRHLSSLFVSDERLAEAFYCTYMDTYKIAVQYHDGYYDEENLNRRLEKLRKDI